MKSQWKVEDGVLVKGKGSSGNGYLRADRRWWIVFFFFPSLSFYTPII